MRLTRDESLLLLIDLQEQLVPAVADPAQCIAAVRCLIGGARRLDIPVLATEHMPDRIGATVAELRGLLHADEIIGKASFSAMGEDGFRTALRRLEREQIVICGTEAHVCVMQSALALAEAGYRVAVVEDAVASRFETDCATALHRMSAAGLTPVTAEMVLFEWTERGDAPEFRDILKIVKERQP